MKRFLLPLVLPLVLLSAGPVRASGLATLPCGPAAVPNEGFVAAIPLGSGALAVFDDYSAVGYDLQANVLGVVSLTGFVGELGQSRASNALASLANGGNGGNVSAGSGSGQVLRTSWTDIYGDDHEVETKVNGTNVDLYVKRHDKLVRAMKRYYPVKQQQ